MILLLAAFLGITIFLLHKYILSPFIYAPIVYSICDLKRAKTSREKHMIQVKLFENFTKLLYCGPVFVYWLSWFRNNRGWEDLSEWHIYLKQLPQDHPEYETVLPIYTLYLGFAFYSFIKDISKNRVNNIAQYMFDFHHILAIYLTYDSLISGYWRGGALTRIIHNPTDLVLYSAKTFETVYKNHVQKETDCLMLTVTAGFWVWFMITRVFTYGFLCLKMTQVWYTSDLEIHGKALLIGTLLMYVLQLVWGWNIYKMVLKYRSGGDTADHIHND